jgi:predicted regulator of Ras-like GTPase activity (Roadblock/LC7/MglB family)
VDAAGALVRLMEDSSQIARAVVLDAGGTLLASTEDDSASTQELVEAAQALLAAAGELHPSADEATRVEVELAAGGLFVLREGGRTIAATTGSGPTAGLVVYDLRTCLHGIDEPKPKRRRAKPKEPDEKADA